MTSNLVVKSNPLAIICVIAFILFLAPTGKTSPVVQDFITPGYCIAESSGSVAYFSAIYDTKLKQPAKISGNVILSEFVEYLKGRYDYNGAAGDCIIFATMADAEASKRDSQARMRQANKQVVEVDWKYGVDEDFIRVSKYRPGEDVVVVLREGRRPTHTYCASDSVQGTIYMTPPVETGPFVNLSRWQRGFEQYLRQKYSFTGQVSCNVGAYMDVGRLMLARMAGAKAAGRKILDTYWIYDAAKSGPQTKGKRRLDLQTGSFADLYFYVYKLSSSSEKQELTIKGLEQAVEAARQIPFYLTAFDLIHCESAADAEKVAAKFPETYKTRTGQVIPLRERAVRLAQSLAAIEKPFLENVWPQHKLQIEKAVARIESTLGVKEEESLNDLIRHLGLEKSEQIVPLYLVAETPWPGGFTIWGKDETRGVCVMSVKAYQGSQLDAGILHEAIHALDLETKGKGNVLVELRDRLLKAGFAEDDIIVRHGPHMLVFIQSSETVRRYIDSTYQPYNEGVFIRPGLEPMVRVQLPIWWAYLDGKLSRAEALDKMVEAFSRARSNNAPR